MKTFIYLFEMYDYLKYFPEWKYMTRREFIEGELDTFTIIPSQPTI
jgi:hypothetical protein